MQAAGGENGSFFRTNNSGYGTQWASSPADAIAPEEVPQYQTLVSIIAFASLEMAQHTKGGSNRHTNFDFDHFCRVIVNWL